MTLMGDLLTSQDWPPGRVFNQFRKAAKVSMTAHMYIYIIGLFGGVATRYMPV